jgi:hypothetical protein
MLDGAEILAGMQAGKRIAAGWPGEVDGTKETGFAFARPGLSFAPAAYGL